MNGIKPKIAIIDPNTLAVLGLKHLLEKFMPFAEVSGFGSFTELEANHADEFFHYFVAINVVLEHRSFFINRKYKTFVLTLSTDQKSQFPEFHSLCINQSEQLLLRDFLELEQTGHAHGRNFPAEIFNHHSTPHASSSSNTGHNPSSTSTPHDLHTPAANTLHQKIATHGTLSARETEVMILIVQGYINKEIADKLNISLPTVVTHRKNIMNKLKIKSVSAMTVFAVMHGYVDISQI